MPSPVAGFRFGAVSAGIRKDGRIDVALAVCDRPAVTVGLFTRNIVRAAPVLIAAERLRGHRARAVLANAGCANACTGEAGLVAARQATDAVAQALGISETEVIPASTGVIGVVLPADKIVGRAGELSLQLRPDGIDDFGLAICTTDRWTKIAEAKIETAGGVASILGIAKGAGMIGPDVGALPHATMLTFLFTDAVIGEKELEAALQAACDRTFNACMVDGDTSTNDTVIAMASGASGLTVSESAILPPLTAVCDELARSMVADGEGTTHVAEIRVRGLATAEEARRVAQTVAGSPLVKTAMFGQDCNWGRWLAAAGRAGVAFDANRAAILIGGVPIVKDGLGVGEEAEARANEMMKGKSYVVEILLGTGPGEASFLTSDLGHGYVDVNAAYRS